VLSIAVNRADREVVYLHSVDTDGLDLDLARDWLESDGKRNAIEEECARPVATHVDWTLSLRFEDRSKTPLAVVKVTPADCEQLKASN